MDLITLEKIPIRIDWSLDKSDNYQVEIKHKNNLISKLEKETRENHYPIEYVNSIIKSEVDSFKEIWSLLISLEILSKYLSQIFLSDYLNTENQDKDLNKFIETNLKNKNPTIGTWNKIIQKISNYYNKNNKQPFFLDDFYNTIKTKEYVEYII